jgi:hypothetical protein
MSQEQNTHPVYIAKDRKTAVKTRAVQLDESMKTVTERYAEHGQTLGLDTVPVADSPVPQIVSQLISIGIATVDEDGTITVDLDPETLPEPAD